MFWEHRDWSDVEAPELAGAFHCHDILGLLHHTDQCLVAARVGTDPTAFGLGDVAADLAEPHLVLHLGQRRDEPRDVLGVGCQQMERDSLRALGPDAGKPAELVNQVLDHTFIHSDLTLGAAAEKPGRRTP